MTYELDSRQSLAFVLSTPTGRSARVRSSELIRRIDRRLRADTSFAMQTMPADIVRQCRGLLGCLALKVRTDYDPSTLRRSDGALLPYREHVRRLRRRGLDYTRYLLVVSNVTLPERPDRVSAVLVDTDIALQLYHDARRDRANWQDTFEARVDSAAVVGGNAKSEVNTPEDVDRFFRTYLEKKVGPKLAQTGHWRPYGSIQIAHSVAHAAVIWDGRTVGSTAEGPTYLTQALAGQHTLILRHPRYEDAQETVVVEAGKTTQVQFDLRLKPASASLGRQIVLWSGAGLVAAGGALSIYAITQDDSSATSACIGDGCTSSTSFQTFGYTPDAGTTEAINPSGVLVAPLGYSLAATGAAWSLGSLLMSEEDEFPWWPFVIGLAAGGLSYGLSAALDGS